MHFLSPFCLLRTERFRRQILAPQGWTGAIISSFVPGNWGTEASPHWAENTALLLPYFVGWSHSAQGRLRSLSGSLLPMTLGSLPWIVSLSCDKGFHFFLVNYSLSLSTQNWSCLCVPWHVAFCGCWFWLVSCYRLWICSTLVSFRWLISS